VENKTYSLDDIANLVKGSSKAQVRAATVFAYYYAASLLDKPVGKYSMLSTAKKEFCAMIIGMIQQHEKGYNLSAAQLKIIEIFTIESKLVHVLLKAIANNELPKEMPITKQEFIDLKHEKLENLKY
jgi:hypothetical protein